MTRQILIGLVTGLLLAAAAAPASAQREEVVELRFDGARSFSRAELSSAIVTTQTTCPNLLYAVLLCWADLGEQEAWLTPRELEADALRLRVYYYERGFRGASVNVDTLHQADGVAVVFTIEEGQPVRVRDVAVVGMPEVMEEARLPLRTGDPFDVVAYEATRDTLLSRLRSQGYPRAQVLLGYSIPRDDAHAASVQYQVVSGARARFGAVRVEGASRVAPGLVSRMLTFREGARYDRQALVESQRNLYGLQLFRHAEVQADLSADTDTIVPVLVRVAEGDMHRVRVGGGFNTVECLNVEGRWTSRNFAGGGRRLDVRGRMGNILVDPCRDWVGAAPLPYDDFTGLLAVDFTQPWFFGPGNNIGVGLFGERRSVPEVFVRTAIGGYVSVGRSLGGSAALTLGYRPEWTRLGTEGDLFFCVNFVACSYEDVNVLREPHWLSPVTLSLNVDRTDALFTPSEGFVVRADLEHAAPYTLSDFAYTRLSGEGSTYIGEAGGVILATRVRGGVAWPHAGSAGTATVRVNPQKRFFAGGANSVRGFDQYRLGPAVLGIDAVPWLVEEDSIGAGSTWPGCTATSINDGSCDVSLLVANAPGRFDLRPAGGELLLEGNLELRFPLPLLGGKLRGAAFLDAGQVWLTADAVALDEIVATPGVGLRYYSPVGPIRIDAGFNTQGSRPLNVLTTAVEECSVEESGCIEVGTADGHGVRNTDDLVTLEQRVAYGSGLDEIDSWGDFFGRFKLHFSIGQAF